MISGVEAVEVGGSGGAAGIGPGGSCRLRWACWLRFPSLARVVLPGIPVPFQLAPGVEVVEAVEVSADPAAGGCVSAGWLLAPAPSNGVGPSSWRGLRHYCGPGQPPAVRVGSMDGEGKAVQGLSCRRWRCWPSVLESSFLGRIQAWRRWRSVAALCVGLRRILSAAAAAAAGRVGLLAGSGSLPSSWRGLRHYCGPASLRRQLRWLRPQRRGKRTVQGLSCRRWRCWPSALESSFLARFRAWRWWRSAAGWLPAPSDTIAAPASLRRQLRWLRPQRQL